MKCEVCGYIDGHSTRCPKYVLPKARIYCAACGEGVYPGEEYIENFNGECRHFDCIYGLRDLIEWLGFEVIALEEEC